MLQYHPICRSFVFLDRESSTLARRIVAVDPVHAVKVVVRAIVVGGRYVNAQQCQFHVCTNWLGDVVNAGNVGSVGVWVAWRCYDAAGIGEVATTVATFS